MFAVFFCTNAVPDGRRCILPVATVSFSGLYTNHRNHPSAKTDNINFPGCILVSLWTTAQLLAIWCVQSIACGSYLYCREILRERYSSRYVPDNACCSYCVFILHKISRGRTKITTIEVVSLLLPDEIGMLTRTYIACHFGIENSLKILTLGQCSLRGD